jgi:glycerol-1-phosphatase
LRLIQFQRIAVEIGVDPNVILATSHGRRTIDVLAQVDPSKANWECKHLDNVSSKLADGPGLDVKHIEGLLPKLYRDSAEALPGSRTLLAELEKENAPWSIVTSGSLPLVNGWLDALELTHPKRIVSAEDVKNGKPDPECYLLGRKGLNLDGKASSARVLVLEDAPAGIRAGHAAGCEVLAVATSHSKEQLAGLPEAKWVVKDLESVKFIAYDPSSGEIEVEISGALQPRTVEVEMDKSPDRR